MFCHYGETDDTIRIGEVVEPNETLMASVIRHCRILVDFRRKPNHHLYLAKVIHGLINHEPVKISIYVIDVYYKYFRWSARHHTPRIALHIVNHLKDIEALSAGQPGPLLPVEIPTRLAIETAYRTIDEFCIYHWDELAHKLRCPDFGDFLDAIDIENN